MSRNTLRLVVDEQGAPETAARSPVQRVFEHWVFMLDKRAGRCVLGPERRRIIERALGLYDEATLLLAIEGCAGSAWHAGQNDRGEAYQDLALILRNESTVERFADMGERIHRAFAREQREELAIQEADEPETTEALARAKAARLRLRAFLAERRGR